MYDLPGEWVSPNEYLPNRNLLVLICIDGDIRIARLDKGTWWAREYRQDVGICKAREIQGWQTLPDPIPTG